MSALQDSHPLNEYRDLVMPDDRIYPTEGGFEGDEPVGRQFHDTEEFFTPSASTLSFFARRV